jgi:hypothetical protein
MIPRSFNYDLSILLKDEQNGELIAAAVSFAIPVLPPKRSIPHRLHVSLAP